MRMKFLVLILLMGASGISYAQNIFPATGNVGIGTSSPTEKLDVIGTVKSNLLKVTDVTGSKVQITPTILQAGVGSVDASKRTIHYEIASHWDASQIQLRAGSSANIMSTIRLQGNWNGTATDNKGGIYFGPNGNDQHVMLNNGNVGIGTTTPKEKLSVNGNIRAREIKVETANWPDYVFDENYEIKSLAEIEAFVNEHKHLPGIPSKKEAEEEGVNLGEMNRKLLEKVEELTLHLIEKDKVIEKQNSVLSNVLQRLDELEEKQYKIQNGQSN